MFKLKEHKWIYISMTFSCCLLLIRIIFAHSLTYIFLGWNLFLAWLPFIISNLLSYRNNNTTIAFILMTWMVFFPNAPYIITDLFHFRERPPVPLYYDLILSFSFAWNGLLLGVISLLNVEQFIKGRFGAGISLIGVMVSLFLCGFGIYIGRYLRWNSWDILMNPFDLSREICVRILNPFVYKSTWVVTGLFTSMMAIIYFNIKKLIQAKA